MNALGRCLPEVLEPGFEKGRQRTNHIVRQIRGSFPRFRLALAGYRVRYRGLQFYVKSPGIAPSTIQRLRRGSYEVPEIEMMVQFLDPTLPVIELGGHMGVVACVTNRLLKRPDQHIVVEPSPLMQDILRGNRALNNCRFKLVEAALSYDGTSCWLKIAGLGSRLTTNSEDAVQVKAVTLAHLLTLLDSLPVSLICDIEGGEYALVEKEGPLLAQHVAWLIFEVHRGASDPSRAEMMRRLVELGFEQVGCEYKTYALRNTALIGATVQ